MKTIFGMIFGWFAGLALAGVMIGFISLFDAGVERLGFTQATARYYILSLMLCITTLVLSEPARRQWKLMGLFGIALFLVLATGLNQSMESVRIGDQSQLSLAHAQLDELAAFGAKAVMYVAPGALVLIYTYLACMGVCEERARKQVSHID